jgi:hypothetical protein
VLARNSSSFESGVNRTREGTYETEIKIPANANGRFSLYAAIASGNIIMGYPELAGISSGGTVDVMETQPSNPTFFDLFSLVILSVFLAGILIFVLKRRR